jgi:hypothetical protein
MLFVLTPGPSAERFDSPPGAGGGLLVADLFDVFQCPDEILHSSLEISIAAFGHSTVLIEWRSARLPLGTHARDAAAEGEVRSEHKERWSDTIGTRPSHPGEPFLSRHGASDAEAMITQARARQHAAARTLVHRGERAAPRPSRWRLRGQCGQGGNQSREPFSTTA